MIVQACLLDIVAKANQNNQQAIRLLHFFESIFKNLNELLEKNEKFLLKSKIYDLIVNFDLKYLNFIGEFAALSKILNSQVHKLIDTEVKIDSGKRIDFKILDTKNNSEILLEIMNLHPKENSYPNIDVNKFLSHRIEQKIIDKTGNNSQKMNFVLLPILWGQYSDLLPFINYFKNRERKH